MGVKRWVEERMSGTLWARVGDVECHTAVDPGSLARDECRSVLSESCWGAMEDIDEDEDVEWRTFPPMVFHMVPVSQGEESGPTPSVLRQTGGRRFGHTHTQIGSDEEPLVTLSHIPVATQVEGSALSSQSDTCQFSLIRLRRVGRRVIGKDAHEEQQVGASVEDDADLAFAELASDSGGRRGPTRAVLSCEQVRNLGVRSRARGVRRCGCGTGNGSMEESGIGSTERRRNATVCPGCGRIPFQSDKRRFRRGNRGSRCDLHSSRPSFS